MQQGVLVQQSLNPLETIPDARAVRKFVVAQASCLCSDLRHVTSSSALPRLRVVSTIRQEQHRLTNRKTFRARRALFPTPGDQGREVLQSICDRYHARQGRDRAGWATSQWAI